MYFCICENLFECQPPPFCAAFFLVTFTVNEQDSRTSSSSRHARLLFALEVLFISEPPRTFFFSLLRPPHPPAMPTLVIIASQSDTPVYTRTFPPSVAAAVGAPPPPAPSTLELLVLNAALDAVDEAAWATRDSYLRTVDTFNDLVVSAYITAAGVRLLLLHDGRGASEEGVRAFFVDVHELWARVALNPLYTEGEPVTSAVFHDRVGTAAARRWP